MKGIAKDFLLHGLISCSFGPILLAVLYLILESQGVVYTVSVNEMALGIFTLSILAFIAGGMNVIYKIERLPLMLAIFIHGAVLYITYLATYLINGWLENGITPILVFTVIFVASYLVIWVIIHLVTKRKTARLNEVLRSKQQS